MYEQRQGEGEGGRGPEAAEARMVDDVRPERPGCDTEAARQAARNVASGRAAQGEGAEDKKNYLLT